MLNFAADLIFCAMIRTILGSILTLLLMACATTAERAARQAETASVVNAAVADRHYKITITQAYPQRGGSVNVSRDFFLEVKGDTLVSYLPFFGRAYRSLYGGTEKGLNFTETIRKYEQAKSKAGVTRIRMQARNEEDSYVYTVEIADNGKASIRVQAMERDDMRYDGDLEW